MQVKCKETAQLKFTETQQTHSPTTDITSQRECITTERAKKILLKERGDAQTGQ